MDWPALLASGVSVDVLAGVEVKIEVISSYGLAKIPNKFPIERKL
ncbi:MAG: hypothetical protein R3E02_05895 [Blastomonas sp.]